MKALKSIDVISTILILVGALNWGLIGLFGFNLVEAIFGVNALTRIIYVLVGLSAIYEIVQLKGMQHRWACEHPGAHISRT